MHSGEARGWELLGQLDPEDVCRRAQASFDAGSGLFTLRVFNMKVNVSPADREIACPCTEGAAPLCKLGGHVRLSTLWYLIGARDIPLSGHLVKPGDMPGGLIYQKGTHVLPLDRIAERYGDDIASFEARGHKLGGEPLEYADCSMRLFPFPRIACVLLLWQKDAEFEARAGFLFDDSCRFHLPVDVIWSTAMMTVLAML